MTDRKVTFEFLSPGCWVTPDWGLILERLTDGWAVKDTGRFVKRGLASKHQAYSWAQDWINGRVSR